MRKFHNNDPPQTTLKHLASIDFEDWYNDVEKSTQLDYRESQQAFRRQIRKITEILDQTQTRCTFFVLGKTAERYPNLVQELQHKGHEIASHGYGHEK
ncbi:MAG: polysaccharide deacetylase family protein, partial [Deltaproteobacteria bacterium]|nr:polysaccharide deacetylase family protein [Deltaproteobacteria bacterium]